VLLFLMCLSLFQIALLYGFFNSFFSALIHKEIIQEKGGFPAGPPPSTRLCTRGRSPPVSGRGRSPALVCTGVNAHREARPRMALSRSHRTPGPGPQSVMSKCRSAPGSNVRAGGACLVRPQLRCASRITAIYHFSAGPLRL
jgi:hypothetical protein